MGSQGTTRVAIATAAAARGLDDDEPGLISALAALGVEAVPAAWDDPSVDWDGYDLVVVRSTWDYAARRDAFLAWARRVESMTRLRNPASVLERNTDKRYLRELEAVGVPIVPTTWVPVGSRPPLGSGEVVVKPAVSAGARDTTRYGTHDHAEALAHVARLHASGREAMVQPFLPEAEKSEIALAYIDGAYSHSVRKAVRLGGDGNGDALFAPEHLTACEPSASQRALAERAVEALVDDPGALLYARVDVVAAGASDLLMEVELTEPSLFLVHAPGATERFAAAIASAARAADADAGGATT